METKTCSMCKIEKHINNFYKKYSECEDRNRKRGLKRYYEKKDKISNQRTIYYEKKDKLLQQQNDRYIHFKDLLRTCVELESRLKATEENFFLNDSENKQIFL